MPTILEEAQEIANKEWNKIGKGWKITLVSGLVLAGGLYLLGKLVKSITVGGFRNRDLYLPRFRR